MASHVAYWLRSFITRQPLLYFASMRLRGLDMSLAVNRETDILITGFGGSGNSYAVEAFTVGQPDKHLAHKLHRPAQVVRAVRWGLPCLVLIRHPIDAIASITARGVGAELSVDALSMALSDYANFYDSIIDLREHFVTCAFKDVTENYAAVINRVNDRFQTDFQVAENGSEEYRKMVAKHRVPGVDRRYAIDDVKEALYEPGLAKLRKRAEKSYTRFCEATETMIWKDPPRSPDVQTERTQMPSEIRIG